MESVRKTRKANRLPWDEGGPCPGYLVQVLLLHHVRRTHRVVLLAEGHVGIQAGRSLAANLQTIELLVMIFEYTVFQTD